MVSPASSRSGSPSDVPSGFLVQWSAVSSNGVMSVGVSPITWIRVPVQPMPASQLQATVARPASSLAGDFTQL